MTTFQPLIRCLQPTKPEEATKEKKPPQVQSQQMGTPDRRSTPPIINPSQVKSQAQTQVQTKQAEQKPIKPSDEQFILLLAQAPGSEEARRKILSLVKHFDTLIHNHGANTLRAILRTQTPEFILQIFKAWSFTAADVVAPATLSILIKRCLTHLVEERDLEIERCAPIIQFLLEKGGEFPDNILSARMLELVNLLGQSFKAALEGGKDHKFIEAMKKNCSLETLFWRFINGFNEDFLREAIESGNTRVIESFGRTGMIATIHGYSPLAYALIHNKIDSAIALLRIGQALSPSDDFSRIEYIEDNFSVLQEAVLEEQNPELLQMLSAALLPNRRVLQDIPFTPVNLKLLVLEITPERLMHDPEFAENVRRNRNSLLLYAVQQDNQPVIRELLKLGASIYAAINDEPNTTIFEYALREKKIGILKIFAELVSDKPRMFLAQCAKANLYNPLFTKALLEHGLEAFHKFDNGHSVIDYIRSKDDAFSFFAVVIYGHGIGRGVKKVRQDIVSENLEKLIAYTTQLARTETALTDCLEALQRFAVQTHWFKKDENIFNKTFAKYLSNVEHLAWAVKRNPAFIEYVVKLPEYQDHAKPRVELARNILKACEKGNAQELAWMWNNLLILYKNDGVSLMNELVLQVNDQQMNALAPYFKGPAHTGHRLLLVTCLENIHKDIAVLDSTEDFDAKDQLFKAMERLFQFIDENKIFQISDQAGAVAIRENAKVAADLQRVRSKYNRHVGSFNLVRKAAEKRKSSEANSSATKGKHVSGSKRASVRRRPATQPQLSSRERAAARRRAFRQTYGSGLWT